MKPAFRLSVLIVAGAAVLLTVGCGRRGPRPNPYQTVVGSQPTNTTLDPIAVEGFDPGALEQRSDDPLDQADFTRFQPVLFAFDSAAIAPAERSKVQEAADFLSANPGNRLVLVGRCDWRGTAEYNLGLGDRRGRAVKDYLATLGVDAGRVEVISKGDQDAVEGATADQMQQDRRVDIGVFE